MALEAAAEAAKSEMAALKKEKDKEVEQMS